MTVVRLVEQRTRDFALSYGVCVAGVLLVLGDLLFQWLWYHYAVTNESLGVRPQDNVLRESDGHHLNRYSIPLLPHPETQDSFLVSMVITCVYHAFVNLFTVAYWLKSSDSPYIKYGVEEDPFSDTGNGNGGGNGGDVQQLFGKFLLLDLDRLWSPRYRHASAIYWLAGPILLRRHCQNELRDPLFRIEAGLGGGGGDGDEELEDGEEAEGDEEQQQQRPPSPPPTLPLITEKSPVYRLRKAQMSMSYRHMPVYSWTLFRFFWFFYVPPVTVLGHIRFTALMIAYNRQWYTFGAVNQLVVVGLAWTTVMIWLLVAMYILGWLVAFLHRRFTVYSQHREWRQEMHRRGGGGAKWTNNNSDGNNHHHDPATTHDKRLKRNQVGPSGGK